MPRINQLSAVDKINMGDLFVIYATGNGDARKAAASVLLQFMQDNLEFPGGFGSYTTQYSSPSATNFNIAISDGGDNNSNVHLILTPTAGYADGAITLPPVAGLTDKQEVLVNCTQQVTAFVVNANGATAVTGAPTSLGADDFFRLKYDEATSTWYRVG